jgi:hypothetical protein
MIGQIVASLMSQGVVGIVVLVFAALFVICFVGVLLRILKMITFKKIIIEFKDGDEEKKVEIKNP